MKINFSLHALCRHAITCIILSTILFFPTTTIRSQCSMACTGDVQVSLDMNCEAEITPDMVLNDDATSCPLGVFIVTIEDHYGNPIPFPPGPNGYPLIDGSLIGEAVYVKIVDDISGNSCWGNLVVEDKLPPTITCGLDTIPCFAASDLVPIVFDSCGAATWTLLNEVVTPLECDSFFIKILERSYQAVDASGNVSPVCTDTIFLERFDFNEIVCPDNFQKALGTALLCSEEYELDANGHPHPNVTGVPTAYGFPLWPNQDFYCNIGVFYSDLELPTPDCLTKYMRTWEIREWWCNIELDTTCLQIIEIVDTLGPDIICPPDMTVSTNVPMEYMDPTLGNINCGAYLLLPPVQFADNCSPDADIHFGVSYPGGFIETNGGPVTLPMGIHTVTYTVYDGCYNSSTCDITVVVVDETAPVAICDEFTVVGLTHGGAAHVYADVFDDGSYDDCKLQCKMVKRMDPSNCAPCPTPDLNGFTYLGTRGGHFYYLSDRAVPGWLAKKEASAFEGHPVIFNNSPERNWVYTQVRDALYEDEFWIGLEKHYSDYEWADGTSLTAPDWQSGQPLAGGEESCVYVNAANNWEDADCNLLFPYVLELDDPCGFSSFVEFCCADLPDNNSEQTVIFRTIDYYGNWNECMVTVEIQNKIPPTITCPPSMIVDCDTHYDLNNLGSVFGDATAVGVCDAMITEVAVEDFDQCGQGTLTRTFTATSGNNSASAVCHQVIYFENPDPFDGYTDINWPDDYDANGCESPDDFGPDVTGYPTYTEDECDLIGANYEDEVFTFNGNSENACFKILRTWTVIDWCQFSQGYYHTWSWTQVIKINNSGDPVITGSCDDIVVCTYDDECLEGNVNLTQTANDDCTPDEDLSWEYSIDAFNNGSFDIGPIHGYGATATATGDYPVGSHKIVWTFKDRCGNRTTCDQYFTVVNCKAPTPYCLNGLAVDLMPVDTDGDGDIDGGEVQLWASDFDAGSYHVCPDIDVVVSFSPDITNTFMDFDCSTLGDQEVTIYATVVDANGNAVVTPDGSLLQAYCITFVNVQDNMGACPSVLLNRFDITGNVFTEMEEDIIDVDVHLVGADNVMDITDDLGSYAFPPMDEGAMYTVDPTKNVDWLNGVSTLDLVMIQRHILGLATLESPYKRIAGDINMDDKISGTDIVELRKLILGLYLELPQNESWRFIDAAHNFVTNDPFTTDFPEVYNIDPLETDMVIDFIGVKVGDVNNTASANFADIEVESRNQKTLSLYTLESNMNSGSQVSVPVYSTENQSLFGMQFTMKLDNGVIFNGLTSSSIEITEDNFAVLDDNTVTFSWNSNVPANVNADQVLFELNLSTGNSANLNTVMDINSSITKAEAYNSDREIMKIALNRDAQLETQFALTQNAPNPFSDITYIEFTIPSDMQVSIDVQDINGKLIDQIKGTFNAGLNKVTFDAKKYGSSGVLYYTMKAGKYTATRKMVILN